MDNLVAQIIPLNGHSLAEFPKHHIRGSFEARSVPDEGLHTHCAILPPSYAAATAIDAIVYDPDAPTAELRRTNVISKSGVATVQQEFPLRTDKNGNPHICVRPDPEEDLEVICLADPE